MTIKWVLEKELQVHINKITEGNYPVEGDYIDETKTILAELKVESESDKDEEVEQEVVSDEDNGHEKKTSDNEQDEDLVTSS